MNLQLYCLIAFFYASSIKSEERLTKLTSHYRITCENFDSIGPYLVEIQLRDDEYQQFHTSSKVWRICSGYCEIVTPIAKPATGDLYWTNYWTLVTSVRHNCTETQTDGFRNCSMGGNRRHYTPVEKDLYTDVSLKVC